MSYTWTLALFGFATLGQAHMKMNYPKPFNFGEDSLNNSPLVKADFPCKQRAGVYDIIDMNYMNAGDEQLVSFNGTATHAGGSCQFSITTDEEPTLASRWAVIQSYEGNCPAVNQTGNLESQSEGAGTLGPDFMGYDRYPLTIPKEVPSGRYTLAWTWLNNQGQGGEFYMNCAPIMVSKGADVNSEALTYLNKLPTMFVANLDSGCQLSTEGKFDFVYPDPGDSVVVKENLVSQPFKNSAGCATITNLGAGSGSMTLPQQTVSGTFPTAQANSPSDPSIRIYAAPQATSIGGGASSTTASQPIASSAIVSNPGGVFAPGASSAAAAPSSGVQEPQTSFTTLLVTQTAEVPAASSAAAAPTGSGSTGGTACSTNGAIVCFGESSFGLCSNGMAVQQAVAAGTACQNGAIVAAARVRRRGFHMRRRHGVEVL